MQMTEYDTGLGTLYERFSIYSLIERLARELNIRSSLEGPLDGIAGINGINSIALARIGVQTTVVLPQLDLIQYAKRYYAGEGCLSNAEFICSKDLALNRQFDMVWNFNCLPQLADHEAVIEQMTRCSRRFILFFVPNTWNYGFGIHRLYHRVEKEPWHHGDIRIMNPGKLSTLLTRKGFKPVRRLYVDVPWWPDIHTPIEEVAARFLPFLKPFIKKSNRLEIYKYGVENFPYFQKDRREEMLRVLSSHPNFESSRIGLLKLFFGHHRGILAERVK
jgi:hypothetical protein